MGRNQRENACTRIRTRDQLIKSQLLYQLSYAGAPVIVFGEASVRVAVRTDIYRCGCHPTAGVNRRK